MKKLTVKFPAPCQHKDNTLFVSVPGSQLFPHTRTVFPLPILHTAPLLMTSLPLMMLFLI